MKRLAYFATMLCVLVLLAFAPAAMGAAAGGGDRSGGRGKCVH